LLVNAPRSDGYNERLDEYEKPPTCPQEEGYLRVKKKIIQKQLLGMEQPVSVDPDDCKSISLI
jgi:hypothetical protein